MSAGEWHMARLAGWAGLGWAGLAGLHRALSIHAPSNETV